MVRKSLFDDTVLLNAAPKVKTSRVRRREFASNLERACGVKVVVRQNAKLQIFLTFLMRVHAGVAKDVVATSNFSGRMGKGFLMIKVKGLGLTT